MCGWAWTVHPRNMLDHLLWYSLYRGFPFGVLAPYMSQKFIFPVIAYSVEGGAVFCWSTAPWVMKKKTYNNGVNLLEICRWSRLAMYGSTD